MLFNTLEFAIFFIIVFGLYLGCNHKWQNRLLLVASYIFYGSWNWRFLFLLFVSTVLDYYCGRKIYQTDDIRRRRFFLYLSIAGNLTILGFFKYFNFFIESFEQLFSLFGMTVHPHTLNIILPVGISFYTFQTMSYTLDIYKKQLSPTNKFLDFMLFVAFFPQLVAGPIERAKNLLPQISSPRNMTLDKFFEGCYLIFWGLFLKIFVADNLASLVDPIFEAGITYRGAKVLLAVYAFAFQIYADFDGYSTIARGLGKCMGFDIMLNFNLPYFATNPRDFWQRWHISLSSWFRDYLYIPLGGNRGGKFISSRNLLITMILAGLWHGAAWTFVVWGIYHGILLLVHRFLQPFFNKIALLKNRIIKNILAFISVIFCFHLVCIGWLIFRANSITQAWVMFQSIFLNIQFTYVGFYYLWGRFIFFSWLVILVQLFQYGKKDLMIIMKSPCVLRAVFYYICFYLLVLYGRMEGKEFIYFVF